MFIYYPALENLVPAVHDTYQFVNDYHPDGMARFVPDRILLRVERQPGDYFEPTPAPSQPWPAELPSLAALLKEQPEGQEFVLEGQIPIMKTWTKPQDHYVEITGEGNVIISFTQSRPLLSQIGIAGEILPTPGHSDHCVSLLLDDGSAFTGDLPPEDYAFDNPVALASWRLLREQGATRVYPAHGPVRSIDETPGQQSRK